MRCAPVEIMLHSHKNCTEEVPVMYKGMEVFVDTISSVVKAAGSPVHCNDVSPLVQIELWECHDLAMLPVDNMQMETVQMSDIGLGKSI